ncbi:unnamed protein product [Ilex paraguariensis]|uniref:DUF913 domain-containing protein n=1 Tax=Ilex paraguariensis TaxID=185542 RepID=A0ABC8RLE1_9AQUA
MDDAMLSESPLPDDILQPLLTASSSSIIDKSLEHLIQIARDADGHSDLASKNILNAVLQLCHDRIRHLTVSNVFAAFVLGIFRSAVGDINFVPRGKSGLPTGSTAIDALGYLITILRDIRATDGIGGFKEEGTEGVVDLQSSGLLELLLSLILELEPPEIIRKAMKLSDNKEGSSPY